MTALARTAVLPFDHLAAELIAFPLGSEAALHNPVTHLDAELRGRTGLLWRAAERELLASAPGISLDELRAMRDDCWFGGVTTGGRSLHRHLGAAAQRHLDALGAGMATRLPVEVRGPLSPSPAHAQARRAWMWLTFALPADLLLASCGDEGWIPQPDLFSPQVRDLLGRGFAETHLHMGASLDFPTVWWSLNLRLARNEVRPDDFRAPGAGFDEGRTLANWLIRAAIARWLLAWYVRATREDEPFRAFLFGPVLRECRRWSAFVTFDHINRAVCDLHAGRLSAVPTFAQLCGAWSELLRHDRRRGHVALPAIEDRDPLESLLTGSGTAEQQFVAAATARLERCELAGRADSVAATLFWQVMRVRVLLYRYLTQRPLTPGLPWFIRFYARMSAARGPVTTGQMLAAAARTSGTAEGLTSLEVRTSPSADLTELKATATALVKDRPDVNECGLVVHFLKIRGGNDGVGGRGTHADPSAPSNNGRFRYSHYALERQGEVAALARLLQQWPRCQMVIRGLDACADEQAIPAWVIRPLLSDVRAAARTGARRLQAHSRIQLPSLRTAVHAGEDFAHLLTGLRNMHEAMDVLELREGDRIGHGLALGLDPALWAARIGRAALPIEDRVFDLAWEWSWWTRRGGPTDAGRLAYIAEEVACLADAWFDEAVDIRQIVRLRVDLSDRDRMRAIGFPARDGPRPHRPRRRSRGWLLNRYLRHGPSFGRGAATVLIDPANEVEALTRIGISLRAEIARRGVAIEINPTSNLLIGDLTDLQNHPLWRLAPPQPRPDLPPLAITIGSDDPLVFNCRLPGEYQLLFDSLLLAGLTDAEAMSWLDQVRRTGLERRFTRAADPGTLFTPVFPHDPLPRL